MKPILFVVQGWAFPSYPILISIAVSLGLLWTVSRSLAWKLRREDTLDAALGMMVGAFVGGRLFHVFLEQPALYWNDPALIFLFWRGGFVYYGGAFGLLTGLFLVSRIKKFSAVRTLESVLPVLAFIMFMGRVACFLAGCCYGLPSSKPWAVTFPFGSQAPAGIPLHPTQLYLAGFWLIAGIGALLSEKFISIDKLVGYRLAMVMMGSGAWRFWVETFRNDERGADLGGFSQGQILSIVIGTLGVVLFALRRRTPQLFEPRTGEG